MADQTRRPDVPLENPDSRAHRRDLATRANASMAKDGSVDPTAPTLLKPYDVADEPDATLWSGSVIYSSDTDVVRFSDGTVWADIGGGGSQTPWTSNIDAAAYDLTSLGKMELESPNTTSDLCFELTNSWGQTTSVSHSDGGAAWYNYALTEIGLYAHVGAVSIPAVKADTPNVGYTYWSQADASLGEHGFFNGSDARMGMRNDINGGGIELSADNLAGTEISGYYFDPEALTVDLGTLPFDTGATVGAGQDNYVLTYDDATKKVSLEAAGGGSQTPWTGDIDGAGYNLDGAGDIESTSSFHATDTTTTEDVSFTRSGIATHPRATFLVGSATGDSIVNAGFRLLPDVTAGTQIPVFIEVVNQSDFVTATKRLGMYQDNSVAKIGTSSDQGSTAGTDLAITTQGVLSTDYDFEIVESSRLSQFNYDVSVEAELQVVGTARLTSTQDVGVATTLHAFQSGLTSGLNIRMDNNEIMAVSNGSVSNLNLNADGGNVTIGAAAIGSLHLRNETTLQFDAGTAGTDTITLDYDTSDNEFSIISAQGDDDLVIDGFANINFDGGQLKPTQTKYCTTDTVVNNSVTHVDITGMTGFALEADAHYKWEACFNWEAVSAAEDHNIRFDFTETEQSGFGTANTTTMFNGRSGNGTVDLQDFLVPANDGGIAVSQLSGYFQANATTGGTLDIQYAQDTAGSGDNTVYVGSWITITKIA